MRRRGCWSITLMGLCVLAGCWNVPKPAAPDRTPRVGLRLDTLELANGLRVVYVGDVSATQVTVTMRYRVGSSDDPAGRAGMAHLAEHVLYEPVAGGVSLFDQLQDVALDFNGITTLDATTYTARAWPAQLATLLEIEAARLEQRCSSVTDAAFARQREVVRNELREHGAYDQVMAALHRGVFAPAHPFHVDAVATDASVAAITRAEACAFIDARYAPGNAVLVVSGPVAPHVVAAALATTLARVHRPAAPPREVTAPTRRGAQQLGAAVEHPHVVIAWPLPAELRERAHTRAVVGMIALLVEAEVDGLVHVGELGEARAASIALVLRPGPGVSPAAAIAGAKRAMWSLRDWSHSGLIEAARERAVYALIATLEDGLARDIFLAEEAFAGRAPHTSVPAQIAALRALDRDTAMALGKRLDVGAATVLTLQPDPAIADEPLATIAPPPHVVGPPRPDDPRAAHGALPLPPSATTATARTRTLPGGMRVVLLPHGAVGTIEVRVVFPVGSAHDPAGQRGLAMLAAHALQADGLDGADMLRFAMAGGGVDVDVGVEQTAFVVRGLEAHLDLLLTGLAHLVRTGGYGELAATQRFLSLAAQHAGADLVPTLAWGRALYGDAHPYVGAGLWERAVVRDVDVVSAFRIARYLPAGATLIIAGGFDPDLADRWIDYAFGDWRGGRAPDPIARAALRPLAFAARADQPQLSVRIALPALGGLATSLVVAEMIDQAFADVRQELAASYGLDARVVELPASSTIAIGGEVDAARAAVAFALMRERLARLREPGEDTAARFVAARRRVVDRLTGHVRTPAILAEGAQHRVAVGRDVGSEAATARAVAELTLPRIAKQLAQLELANAAIFVRGREAAIGAAFGAIERQPVLLDP